jgi:hypothetical protein
MLSASRRLARTRLNVSTPQLHRLNIGSRTSDLNLNLDRPFRERNFIYCARPAKSGSSLSRISLSNERRTLQNSSTSTRPISSGIADVKMADVETVLAGKYPAKAHARRVVEYIRKTNPNARGTLYLEGQKTRMIEDNDEPMPFRYDLAAFNTC